MNWYRVVLIVIGGIAAGIGLVILGAVLFMWTALDGIAHIDDCSYWNKK